MAEANGKPTKCLIVGAGPVGALAALYAANRGWDVELYELRGGLHSNVAFYDCKANGWQTRENPEQSL